MKSENENHSEVLICLCHGGILIIWVLLISTNGEVDQDHEGKIVKYF